MISSDATTWEAEPLQKLVAEGQLQTYRHNSFWQPMEILRDRVHLKQLWECGKAPWKRW
jgi:glucose-1-phosphate cytidylyltransferase